MRPRMGLLKETAFFTGRIRSGGWATDKAKKISHAMKREPMLRIENSK